MALIDMESPHWRVWTGSHPGLSPGSTEIQSKYPRRARNVVLEADYVGRERAGSRVLTIDLSGE